MISIWLLIGLITATVAVATLGAGFSVLGIAALFSGAAIASGAMAVSLEFAKFVLSAYLHQRWQKLNSIYKYYLSFSIVVLSLITSMGIFGFLSGAYQSATNVLESENIKLAALKEKQRRITLEIDRLNKSVDEIPVNRVSKRIQIRAEIEPAIADFNKQIFNLDALVAESDLKILAVKEKVGPLIYIAKTFNVDIDTVVKYLILLFVFVFDPLAICLVIATTESLESRKKEKEEIANDASATAASSAPKEMPAESDSELIQMRFVDSKDKNVV